MTATSTKPVALPFELDSLSRAVRYQQWVADTVRPYLGQRILEIGSGIGSMSRWMPVRERLVLTEADPGLIPLLRSRVESTFPNDPRVEVHEVDVSADWTRDFRGTGIDTVVSFNVLEHIEDDAAVLRSLVDLLGSGGSQADRPRRIVSFVPAHGWAFGGMDRTFGHFRRYSARDFERLLASVAPGGRLECRYFNLAGLPGWFFMGRVLGRAQIGASAIEAFEHMVPWIRGVDDFVHGALRVPLGQSLLAIITV
jgi:SAM-dependent methyltransferase